MASPIRPAGDGPRLRLGYLDGLRALAALWVVLDHAWFYWFTTQPVFAGWRGMVNNWILYGHLAVDVFIVLSGFCLTLPVARGGALKGGARGFFARRARRILPPFYASLVLCGLLHWLGRTAGHDGPPPTAWGTLANALLLQDLFPAVNSQFNLPFWSVAVEWKIYFLFPLLLWTLRLAGISALLAAAALLAVAYTLLLRAVFPGMTLELTCPWYVFLFGMGVSAGWAASRPDVSRRLVPWTAGAALLGAVFQFSHFPLLSGDARRFIAHLPWTDVAVGALASCLLILLAAAAPGTWADRARGALSARPLVICGTFAYSIYLCHFPLLGTTHRLLAPHLGGLSPLMQFWAYALVSLPCVLAASYLFFLLFERPFLNTHKHEPPAETARDAALAPAP